MISNYFLASPIWIGLSVPLLLGPRFQQRRSDAVGIQAGCCDANMERVMTETKTRLVLLP